LPLNDPLTAQQLAGELNRQAGMRAFVDAFWLVTWSFIVMTPLVWFLKRPAPAANSSRGTLTGH
jgi:hypothetical protein